MQSSQPMTWTAQRWMVTAMYDPEICYECQGYGDDWKEDENGELVSACDDCPFNGEDDCDDC